MRIRGLLSYAAVSALIAGVPAPAWAGGGSGGRLVFQSEAVAGDHTQSDIVSIGADGSRLRRLTDTKDLNENGPSWNGAGTRVVFWRTPAPFGAGSVWTMDADGRHQRRLTGSGTDARDPVFDRAGRRIAYTKVDSSGFHLWLMRADGSGKRALTRGAAEDFEPSWSPDGKWLAFTRGRGNGDPGDLYVLKLATGRVTRVTATADYDHQVDWSPDGRRLVFERDTPSTSSIFTVRPDGRDTRRLTTGPFFDVGPAWSPDGRRVAFGSDRGGVLDDLWVVPTAGGSPHRVRALAGSSDAFPDWRR